MSEYEDEAPPVAVSNGGKSLVDLIKQEQQEIADRKDVFIPVVGYEVSGLAIKYRMPEGGRELDSVAQRIEKQNKDRYYQTLWTSVDTMVLLCEGLYVKPDGVEEYIMLDPEDTGTPIRFDARAAVLVGLDENSPGRQVVRKLFGNNDLAILNHYEKLNRWLTNTKADVTKELWQVATGG